MDTLAAARLLHIPPSRRGTAHACASCHLEIESPVEIAHDVTGEQLTLCLRCLRSALRMKADFSARHARNTLHAYAQESGCEIWRGSGVLYVLPPSGAFEPLEHDPQLLGAS